MTPPIIFLDIDGVLNTHERLANGYCGTNPANVLALNTILKSVWIAQIVVSSAWRYNVINGWMTVRGFEELLKTHGVQCGGRLRGVTSADPTPKGDDHDWQSKPKEWWAEQGLRWRTAQILEYIAAENVGRYVVLDDLPLEVPNLIQTNPNLGLGPTHAVRAIEILTGTGEAEAMSDPTTLRGWKVLAREAFDYLWKAGTYWLNNVVADYPARREEGCWQVCARDPATYALVGEPQMLTNAELVALARKEGWK